MNYESMTDRELDAVVAEKVMGLKVLPEWEHCWSAEDDLDMLGESERNGSQPHPVYVDEIMLSDDDDDTSVQGFSKWIVCAVPRYSRFVADAFRIVEAMRERGRWFEIETEPQGWHVVIGVEPGCTGEEASHESLPRAIVIAALRALDE